MNFAFLLKWNGPNGWIKGMGIAFVDWTIALEPANVLAPIANGTTKKGGTWSAGINPKKAATSWAITN